MKKPPTFVSIIVAVVVVGLFLVALGAWQVVKIGERETQRDCDRAVATRDDARSMWLYVIQIADEDADQVARFAAELNDKLPPLKCVDGNPLPDRS